MKWLWDDFARVGVAVVMLSGVCQHMLADGPADNVVDNVRQIPPEGIDIPAETREKLQTELNSLQDLIAQLGNDPAMNRSGLLPDIEIFARAVDQALKYNELYSPKEIENCSQVLDEGRKRAEALQRRQPYWLEQTGFVVRGFRSRLDGTVQPYGLEIPRNYNKLRPVRCDLWLHGRGEKSLETQFIVQRMSRPGPYHLESGIILHPYGRYSNAFKFAGEVDILEALEHAQQYYNIDEDRIAIRGFSMGGAGCWQMTVHYADRFFASTPGAGFSETPEFLKFFQNEELHPLWYEEKLWNMYDAPGWVINLHQIPTIAYSGEIDRQKQAADVMEAAALSAGIDLMHVIGPETAHKIHPDANILISEKMDSLAREGRQQTPNSVYFATYTLKYNRMNWITVHRLQEHWQRSEIIAHRSRPRGGSSIAVKTDNIADFSIDFPAGTSPFPLDREVSVVIGDTRFDGLKSKSDRSFHCRFHFDGNAWQRGAYPTQYSLVKQHNLQGPIDDALMDSFLFVRPTGTAINQAVEKWVKAEMEHAIVHWRQQMRGDVRIKDDTAVTEDDIKQHHLILWGCPQSNSVYKQMAGGLPVQWQTDGVHVGDRNFSVANSVPLFVYPNPLNPQRYIVSNSSFTYREYDYLNNARQTPKLPDWAIIDIAHPPNSRFPGKIIAADFFDENWNLKPARAGDSTPQ